MMSQAIALTGGRQIQNPTEQKSVEAAVRFVFMWNFSKKPWKRDQVV